MLLVAVTDGPQSWTPRVHPDLKWTLSFPNVDRENRGKSENKGVLKYIFQQSVCDCSRRERDAHGRPAVNMQEPKLETAEDDLGELQAIAAHN